MDRVRIGGMVSSLLVLIGGIMLVMAPGQQARKALAEAESSLATESVAISEVREQLDNLGWYCEAEAKKLTDPLREADRAIAAAEEAIVNADGSAAEILSAVKTAQASLALAAEYRITAAESIDEAKNFVESLYSREQYLKTDLSRTEEALVKQRTRLETLRPALLTKYVGTQTDATEQAASALAQVRQTCQLISDLLPPAESRAMRGDPSSASALLTEAGKLHGVAASRVKEITSAFDLYQHAATEGPEAVAQVEAQVAETKALLEDVVATTPLRPELALKYAYENHALATRKSEEARRLVTTPVENGIADLPAAYLLAGEVAAVLNGVVAEASRQQQLSAETVSTLQAVAEQVRQLNGSIKAAQSSVAIFERHERSTWQSLDGNLPRAQEIVNSLDELNDQVEAAQAQQRFEDALSGLKRLIASAEEADRLVTEVTTTAAALERHRAAWPDAERRAVNAIEEEQDDIDSYGEYSYTAQRSFDNAEESLDRARDAAARRQFEYACDLASQVVTQANGVGLMARRAYDDYREEQERVAAAAAFEDDDSFSGSYSSGGSSYDDSSFGGSSDSWSGSSSSYDDGGGWGSYSSSSDDGGGWSGSSSSDDGGGW